jgi:hypothetical protein
MVLIYYIFKILLRDQMERVTILSFIDLQEMLNVLQLLIIINGLQFYLNKLIAAKLQLANIHVIRKLVTFY